MVDNIFSNKKNVISKREESENGVITAEFNLGKIISD